jgi:hypothetical protein
MNIFICHFKSFAYFHSEIRSGIGFSRRRKEAVAAAISECRLVVARNFAPVLKFTVRTRLSICQKRHTDDTDAMDMYGFWGSVLRSRTNPIAIGSVNIRNLEYFNTIELFRVYKISV